MKQPDPVKHMMAWGATSSGIVLLLYFLLMGEFTTVPVDFYIFAIIFGGVFTGYTLGGMAGVIIGTFFQHGQIAVNSERINNRRYGVMFAVFAIVLIVSRLLIILSVGFVQHPLALSLLGAVIAGIGSQHYLYRMEAWLKQEKPKRKLKNDTVANRLVDNDEEIDLSALDEELEQMQQSES